MTKFQRSLANQQITLKDAIISEYEPAPLHRYHPSRYMAIGIVIGLALAGGIVKMCAKPTEHTAQIDCLGCHQRIQSFADYFRKAGSKSPQQLAEAVLSTRNPRLMAAVAKVERTPHTARNTGYKNRYSGAWQTSKHWGKVTDDVTQQALIAEFALESHVKAENGDIIRGLNAYGGHTDKVRGKYAYNILRELEGAPR